MSVIELTPRLLAKTTGDLQVVVIDSFYDAVNQPEAMTWLGNLFRFKVNSYRASYPYGILPFGGTDLIGTHWILCRQENSELRPLMGFKTIDSRRTDQFRMEFPAFGIVAEPELAVQRAAIAHELDKARKAGVGLGYLGSWSVDPSTRKDAVIAKLCRKFSAALYTQWVRHFNIQSAVTFASLRFHVEKFHAYMGLTRLTSPNGEALPDFNARPFFDEPACVSVLYRENHSVAAQQDAEDLKELWDRRIVIGSESSPLLVVPSPARAA